MSLTREQLLLLGLGGAVLLYAYLNQDSIADTALDAAADAEAIVSGWQNVQQGPVWVPVINQTESALGIVPNLLARMAFQESHFRPEIIDGTHPSPAGALGILQLMPPRSPIPAGGGPANGWFASVLAPRPFSAQDTAAQIQEAGEYLVALYEQFGDWGLAIAAYNDGPAAVSRVIAGQGSYPQETLDYVSGVLADVPAAAMGSAVA